MSEADPDVVTVSTDGITVKKTVDTEEFQMLAVVIELASEREDAARIKLVDPLPDSVQMDEVRFHPEYGAEHWSVEDGTVVFERDLATRENYTTIYVIDNYPHEEAAALLDKPDLEMLESRPESVDEVLDEDRSEVVRDFIGGEADLPGLEGDLTTAAEPAQAAEETPAESATGSEETTDEPAPGAEETRTVSATESEVASAESAQASGEKSADDIVRAEAHPFRGGSER